MSERVAVLVPCYKRKEYTSICIAALESAQNYENVDFYLVDDGSNDETEQILNQTDFNSQVIVNKESKGLRNVIIEFFETMKDSPYDYLSKLDNDCVVPKNWLSDILKVFRESDADILSPNVMPSNAAFTYGKECGLKYMPAETVGGLWTMKKSMIDGVQFDSFPIQGITGAFNILRQIVLEKEPKIGWLKDVTVEDIGHWSGGHPLHIKSKDHLEYSMEVGRRVSWA